VLSLLLCAPNCLLWLVCANTSWNLLIVICVNTHRHARRCPRALLMDWRRDWVWHLLLHVQGQCHCPCYGDDQVVRHQLVSPLPATNGNFSFRFCIEYFSDKLCSTFTAILLSLNWALTPSSPTLLTRLLTNTRWLRRYDTLIVFLLSQFNVLTYSPNVNFLLVYLIVWWLLIHLYFFWHHNYPIKSFDSLACWLQLIEPQTSSWWFWIAGLSCGCCSRISWTHIF